MLHAAACALLPPRPARRSARCAASRAAPCAATPAARCAAPALRSPLRLAARRHAGRAAAGAEDGDKPAEKPEEREYDEDGLYIGTYSTFFSDPSQLRGVVIFCAVLASFFSLGNIGAAIVLPIL
jgi:hypothetical protein